jgi:hypothetical protein
MTEENTCERIGFSDERKKTHDNRNHDMSLIINRQGKE